MPTLGYKDSDGIDVGNKYVTKEYMMDWYPDIITGMKAPQLLAWGLNGSGELGTGQASNKPIQVLNSGGSASIWNQVSFGAFNSAAIKSDGTLWTWGNNDSGQLGNGASGAGTSRTSPGSTAGAGTNWRQVDVAGGQGITSYMAAVKTDGTLWTWGVNSSGQLGSGVTTARSSPDTTAGGGTTWKQVSCYTNFTAAIKTDGTLWTWGLNASGQLGTGTTTNRSSPNTTAGGGTNWKTVACGYNVAAAIKTDGTLWTWGLNASGQLGTGTTTNRSSPDTTAGGGTNWKTVACGFKLTAAIKSDGTLWTWGLNASGQLGTGTTTNRSSPNTTAGGGTNWKQVNCDIYGTAAIKTDGTLWTWGDNYASSGHLGTGSDTGSRSSPGSIYGGGTNWKQITCGYLTMAAISENEGW
jgi:hypothetical protein